MSATEQERTQTAAREFIESRMAPQDLVRIVAADFGGPTLLADFTDDRPMLLAAIRNIPRRPDPPPIDDEEGGFVPDADEFATFNADHALSGLEVIAEQLAKLGQRKSLFYFVTPRDLAVPNRFRSAVDLQLTATINRANGANVTIYPIEIGQTQTTQDTLAEVLSRLAVDTGGAVPLAGPNLTMQIAKAERPNDSYYLIGYRSHYTDSDHSVRHVRISLQGVRGKLTFQETFVMR